MVIVKDQAESLLVFGLRRRAARGFGGSGCGCVL